MINIEIGRIKQVTRIFENRRMGFCKVRTFLLLFLLLILISCSDLTSPEEAARIQINSILDDIEDAVFRYEPETILTLLHRDFLHNGNDRESQESIWEQRLLLFDSLSIDDRTVVSTDHTATASFQMTFAGADTVLVTREPSEEYGDLSYFIRDMGEWYLYGNQIY